MLNAGCEGELGLIGSRRVRERDEARTHIGERDEQPTRTEGALVECHRPDLLADVHLGIRTCPEALDDDDDVTMPPISGSTPALDTPAGSGVTRGMTAENCHTLVS